MFQRLSEARIVPDDLDDSLAKRIVVCNGAKHMDVARIGRYEDPVKAQPRRVADS